MAILRKLDSRNADSHSTATSGLMSTSTPPLSTPFRKYSLVFGGAIRRDRLRLATHLPKEIGEVLASEFPLERPGRGSIPVILKIEQTLRLYLKACEVVGGENVAFARWRNRSPPDLTSALVKNAHLCSDRVAHTKNRICPLARENASDIIHAEGVRFAVPSSAPPTRKALNSLEGIRRVSAGQRVQQVGRFSTASPAPSERRRAHYSAGVWIARRGEARGELPSAPSTGA
jgi:hypothetical protein